MKRLIIHMQKGKIVISILLIFISVLGFSKEKEKNDAIYSLMSCITSELPKSKVFVRQMVLQIDWSKYLNKEFLETKNSGIDQFFEPVLIGLTDEDILGMIKCSAEQNRKKWSKKYFNGIKLIREKRKVNYLEKSTYKFSYPVFNKDFTIALVAEEEIKGMENAWQGIFIYKFENGQWQKVAFIQLWIS